MASILDQIKRNALPAGAMRSAAKGSLPVPPAEMVEILVYLTNNAVFGQDAKLTLAGWDLEAAKEIARNASAPPEVLGYFWMEGNRRPALMPILIDNPAVSESMLMELAGTAPREIVRMLLDSPRARSSLAVMEALGTNPRVTPQELEELQGPGPTESELAAASAPVAETSAEVAITARGPASPAAAATSSAPSGASSPASSSILSAEEAHAESDPVADAAHLEWIQQYAAEVAAEEGKAFQLMGEELESSEAAQLEGNESVAVEPEEQFTPAPVSDHLALAAMAAAAKRTAVKPGEKKLTPLQKIARLGAAERVKLAFTGNKEERAILIRDGAKIVQNAVLASPKLTDPEVETFAAAKNLSENVFREIARNRRFMKNYHVVRNLVQNPRAPLDIALPLVKMLLVYDLKGMQHSRTISETIRKLAQKYYKEKATSGGKTKD